MNLVNLLDVSAKVKLDLIGVNNMLKCRLGFHQYYSIEGTTQMYHSSEQAYDLGIITKCDGTPATRRKVKCHDCGFETWRYSRCVSNDMKTEDNWHDNALWEALNV
jgi:hypothetical protein